MLYRAAAQHPLCAAQARLHSSAAAAVLSIAQTRQLNCSRGSLRQRAGGHEVATSSPSVWQSHGGWYLHTTWQQQTKGTHMPSAGVQHPPTVTIVDGHSLVLSTSAARSSTSLSSSTVGRQLEEWLQHLKQYTRADVLYVAFDNKGSAAGNARAQLLPAYLSKRYKKQPAPGRTSSAAADRLPVSSRTPEAGTLPNAWSVNPFDPRRTQSYSRSSTAARYPTAAKDNTQTSHGWPAAAGGSSSSSSSSSRGSVPRAWLDAVAAAGGVAVPAALGYEADDAVAALVAWCEQQAPAPLVFLVSADADLWQLTSPTTFWLQLARGPTRACPAGLALNTAAGFQQHHGYPPGLHGDVLALTGKPEAGVPGAGVSKRACKQLVLRYGTLQDILGAVQSAEGPPPALRHQLQQLWGNLSSAAAALEAAQQRLPVVQLHPGPQHLPAAVGAAYAAAASSARQVIAAGGSPAAAAQQQALMHPPQRHRRAQCVPYRRLLREALARLGLDHYQEDWLSPEGFLFDLVVARQPRQQQQQQQQQGRVHDPALSSVLDGSSGGMSVPHQQQPEQPWLPATCWVVQLVAPSQYKAGGDTPTGTNSSSTQPTQQDAVAATAQRLRQQVPPCNGRLTGQLKGQLRNAAAGQLALYVRSQWRVVLVPFQELWAAGDAGDLGAGAPPVTVGQEAQLQLLTVDAAAAYLKSLLAEQGHP